MEDEGEGVEQDVRAAERRERPRLVEDVRDGELAAGLQDPEGLFEEGLPRVVVEGGLEGRHAVDAAVRERQPRRRADPQAHARLQARLRDALAGDAASDSWAFPEAGRPLLEYVFCRDALFAKRLLLVAMQVPAAGGIRGATFRVGAVPSAIETAVSAWLARAGNRTQALRFKCYFANADSKGAPAKLFEEHMTYG